MGYSDEQGYVAVDRDAAYLVRFRVITGFVIGMIALAASIPSVRDWAWRSFLPADYARAHTRPTPPSDADMRTLVEGVNSKLRRCADGQVVLATKCADGSAGQPLQGQPAK